MTGVQVVGLLFWMLIGVPLGLTVLGWVLLLLTAPFRAWSRYENRVAQAAREEEGK